MIDRCHVTSSLIHQCTLNTANSKIRITSTAELPAAAVADAAHDDDD